MIQEAFKYGRDEVTDDPRSGRPITTRNDDNVKRVCKVLRLEGRLTIQKITDTINMAKFVVYGITIEDLQM